MPKRCLLIGHFGVESVPDPFRKMIRMAIIKLPRIRIKHVILGNPLGQHFATSYIVFSWCWDRFPNGGLLSKSVVDMASVCHLNSPRRSYHITQVALIASSCHIYIHSAYFYSCLLQLGVFPLGQKDQLSLLYDAKSKMASLMLIMGTRNASLIKRNDWEKWVMWGRIV